MEFFEQIDDKTVEDVAAGTMQIKRKQRVMYYKFPMFWRPFVLFVYWYILRVDF
jgi:hypothetical protein